MPLNVAGPAAPLSLPGIVSGPINGVPKLKLGELQFEVLGVINVPVRDPVRPCHNAVPLLFVNPFAPIQSRKL